MFKFNYIAYNYKYYLVQYDGDCLNKIKEKLT